MTVVRTQWLFLEKEEASVDEFEEFGEVVELGRVRPNFSVEQHSRSLT